MATSPNFNMPNATSLAGMGLTTILLMAQATTDLTQ
jgi:hypothetical protein